VCGEVSTDELAAVEKLIRPQERIRHIAIAALHARKGGHVLFDALETGIAGREIFSGVRLQVSEAFVEGGSSLLTLPAEDVSGD
jgi:hypothetical protein